MPKSKKKEETPNEKVSKWVEIENKEDSDIVKHLENAASKNFDGNDELDVSVLQGVYGQESSYGTNYKEDKKGDGGATGHFQIEKKTGTELGLTMTEDNDERFDLKKSSDAAARYLKKLDGHFSKEKDLGKGVKGVKLGERVTVPVKDSKERMKFVLAAYNSGGGRIAKAQQAAERAKKDSTVWNNVKEFLEEAGATDEKAKEIKDYVESVLNYKEEFSKKSKAKNSLKKRDKDKDKDKDKKIPYPTPVPVPGPTPNPTPSPTPRPPPGGGSSG